MENKEILPGLTAQGAALLLQLAQQGFVTLQQDLQKAMTALGTEVNKNLPQQVGVQTQTTPTTTEADEASTVPDPSVH